MYFGCVIYLFCFKIELFRCCCQEILVCIILLATSDDFSGDDLKSRRIAKKVWSDKFSLLFGELYSSIVMTFDCTVNACCQLNMVYDR